MKSSIIAVPPFAPTPCAPPKSLALPSGGSDRVLTAVQPQQSQPRNVRWSLPPWTSASAGGRYLNQPQSAREAQLLVAPGQHGTVTLASAVTPTVQQKLLICPPCLARPPAPRRSSSSDACQRFRGIHSALPLAPANACRSASWLPATGLAPAAPSPLVASSAVVPAAGMSRRGELQPRLSVHGAWCDVTEFSQRSWSPPRSGGASSSTIKAAQITSSVAAGTTLGASGPTFRATEATSRCSSPRRTATSHVQLVGDPSDAAAPLHGHVMRFVSAPVHALLKDPTGPRMSHVQVTSTRQSGGSCGGLRHISPRERGLAQNCARKSQSRTEVMAGMHLWGDAVPTLVPRGECSARSPHAELWRALARLREEKEVLCAELERSRLQREVRELRETLEAERARDVGAVGCGAEIDASAPPASTPTRLSPCASVSGTVQDAPFEAAMTSLGGVTRPPLQTTHRSTSTGAAECAAAESVTVNLPMASPPLSRGAGKMILTRSPDPDPPDS